MMLNLFLPSTDKHIMIKLLNRFFVICMLLMASSASHAAPLVSDAYTIDNIHHSVVLQAYIDGAKQEYTSIGKRHIIVPSNIRFTGVLKAVPEKKPTGYLYTSLQLMQVKPLPLVEYQSFIASPANSEQSGEVIAIYMDNRLAQSLAKINPSQFVDKRLTWYGYHIYNYSRGPAIVLENVDLESRQ
jgi:hypothetical protein